MRKDYDEIKGKFADFIRSWKSKDTSRLNELINKEVHAYISVIGNSEEGEQHSLFGIRAFISDIPETDQMEYEITELICRINKSQTIAHQSAQVPVIAKNNDGKYFMYCATFANGWNKEEGEWKMNEIRIDIKDYDSPLREEFAKKWFFENPQANLTATVHLNTIFPDIDSPYWRIQDAEDILTEKEKVEECFSKFIYGIDWIVFTYVRDTLADDFMNDDKRKFIRETKWERQRWRYWCHPYTYDETTIDNDRAVIRMHSLLPDCGVREAEFVKREGRWLLLSFR